MTGLSTGSLTMLRTSGSKIVDAHGTAVRLRGVCIGGWLNMENFLTGYAANEQTMRELVRAAIGDDAYRRFFDRMLFSFFGEDDARFLAAQGFNSVRIPVNYRHFESDSRPFELLPDAFAHLDRAIESLGRHGIYSIIDLHSLPGSQNHDWHSDNPTHRPAFWDHPHLQDRAVAIWEQIADHYVGNPFVAGYNLMNEPADESCAVVGPVYERILEAVRRIDPDHTIYLDGNTYSTQFDIFEQVWDNTVYTLHDYVPAGFGRGGPYPGITDGAWVDKESAERKFLERSEFARRTDTPIVVGEFGPVYMGDAQIDSQRQQILDDQLELYRRHEAGWSLWVYKDLGRQGVVNVREDSPYRRRFDPFVAKKNRLGADHWGSTEVGVQEVTQPVQDLVASEFPSFDPYPWGRWDFVRRLVLNVMIARPLAEEYADLLRGLDNSELDALADSFAFVNCEIRESLLEQLRRG